VVPRRTREQRHGERGQDEAHPSDPRGPGEDAEQLHAHSQADHDGAKQAFTISEMRRRKAWLFADTVAGAEASANLYSLVETAKANGIELSP